MHDEACPATAGTVPKGTNQTPGRVCKRFVGTKLSHAEGSPSLARMSDPGGSTDKRLRLCRCPKGAAASRQGSGINASGEAEAKQASTKAAQKASGKAA